MSVTQLGYDESGPLIHDYQSTGIFETLCDLGPIPEGEVWTVSADITAGTGGGDAIAGTLSELRGEAERKVGGVAVVGATGATPSGTLSVAAKLQIIGGRLLVRMSTPETTFIKTSSKITVTKLTGIATA